MVDIEALARSAEAAADALPSPANDRQRLLFGRIQSLVTKTSEQASASLRFANAQVTVLAAHLEARRSTEVGSSTRCIVRRARPSPEIRNESKFEPEGSACAGRCTVSGPPWSADPRWRVSHRAAHAVSRVR
jgi:hypothetical protein